MTFSSSCEYTLLERWAIRRIPLLSVMTIMVSRALGRRVCGHVNSSSTSHRKPLNISQSRQSRRRRNLVLMVTMVTMVTMTISSTTLLLRTRARKNGVVIAPV